MPFSTMSTSNWATVGREVFHPRSQRLGQIITPVNDDGYVAVAFSGEAATVVDVIELRPAHDENPVSGGWGLPTPPQRNWQPVQSFVAGYTTADGYERTLRCDQNNDGSAEIDLRSTNVGMHCTLSRIDLFELADAWEEVRAKKRALPRPLNYVGFGFVPTMFDNHAGTDTPFGGVPPELTERALDWVVSATQNNSR